MGGYNEIDWICIGYVMEYNVRYMISVSNPTAANKGYPFSDKPICLIELRGDYTCWSKICLMLHGQHGQNIH